MNKLHFKPRAVLFDMDGVIVDSMPYHFISWYEALRQFDVRVTCWDVYVNEGENWKKSLRKFLKQSKKKPQEKLMSRIFSLRQKTFNRYFKRFFFAGALESIDALKKAGYILGIVTGTHDLGLRKILNRRIISKFDTIITGDRLRHGKPHPEPYLKAACKLKIKPSQCIVIENAPFGIKSAKSAGMFCIAVTTSLQKEYLKEADIIIDDIRQLKGIIPNISL